MNLKRQLNELLLNAYNSCRHIQMKTDGIYNSPEAWLAFFVKAPKSQNPTFLRLPKTMRRHLCTI